MPLASPIANPTGAFTGTGPLELPDGRVLFSSVASGRTRLPAALRGQEAVPFVQTDEDTSGPTALIGNHSVAFFMGSLPDIALVVASTDGRIVRRLGDSFFAEFPATRQTAGHSFTPHRIWALETEGGDVRKLHGGDAVTLTPDGESLIVHLIVGRSVPPAPPPDYGGAPAEIPVLGKNYLAPRPRLGIQDGPLAFPTRGSARRSLTPEVSEAVPDFGPRNADREPVQGDHDLAGTSGRPDPRLSRRHRVSTTRLAAANILIGRLRLRTSTFPE